MICSTSDTANERLNRNENQNSTALNLAFKNITNHLKKNDWNSARFEWAKTTNMRFFTNSDNSITYDFFLNLEESFGNIMHVYQTFIFDYHCCKDKCSVNGIKKQQEKHIEQTAVSNTGLAECAKQLNSAAPRLSGGP